MCIRKYMYTFSKLIHKYRVNVMAENIQRDDMCDRCLYLWGDISVS